MSKGLPYSLSRNALLNRMMTLFGLNHSLYQFTVVIQSVADLPTGVLDPNVVYDIDGSFDVGDTPIIIGSGGARIMSNDINTKGLYSTSDNHILFATENGSYAGNVSISNMFIGASGDSSKLFDLDNDGNLGSLELINVNVGNFGFDPTTEAGDLTAYRQYRFAGCGFILLEDGFTMNGASGGLVIRDSIALSLPSMTLFKEGTGLTINNVRSNINFNSVEADTILIDFQESNINNKAGVDLQDVSNTIATDPLPNLPSTSLKARFRNCIGFRNTYVGGQWLISSEVETDLTSVSAGVFLKVAGVTTQKDLQWFTAAVSNAIKYEGDQTLDVIIEGNLSFSGTNNDVVTIHLRQWDDSTSSYIELAQTGGSTLNAGNRAEDVSFNGIATVDLNDRIEVWVSSSTAKDVTALENGYVIISERGS